MSFAGFVLRLTGDLEVPTPTAIICTQRTVRFTGQIHVLRHIEVTWRCFGDLVVLSHMIGRCHGGSFGTVLSEKPSRIST